jgi:phenylpropionate dioxygenase-like ring-hydroxylating dioxygenase large terminal subunit
VLADSADVRWIHAGPIADFQFWIIDVLYFDMTRGDVCDRFIASQGEPPARLSIQDARSATLVNRDVAGEIEARWRLVETAWDLEINTSNFVDFSHFAWLHDGVLAERDQPLVPDHEVQCDGWELRTHVVVVDEPAHTEKTATLGLYAETVTVPGRRNYRIPLPFSVWIQQELPDDKRFVLFMACQPVGSKKCRTFTFVARNFGLDTAAETFILHQQEIVEADRVVAESQLPEELPADLSEEMYVSGADQISVEYRRWLLEMVKEHEHSRSVGSNGQET